jgi:hypothetical protein
MTLYWAIFALLGAGILVAAAALLSKRGRRRSAGGRRYDRSHRHRREDPLHRRATHYLASGALPRWDP